MSRLAFSCLLCFASFYLVAAVGADKDPVKTIKDKLEKAKSSFEEAKKKFQKELLDLLQSKEDAARRVGNKKTVDQIKEDREAFETDGTIPNAVPTVAYQKSMAKARRDLIAAHRQAIREYTKIKEDSKANVVEADLKELRRSFAGNTLKRGMMLFPGDSLVSSNGNYELTMQLDGNLVLSRLPKKTPMWGAQTNGKGAVVCIMQEDGNLVIYDQKNGALWASNTSQPNASLVVQNDGNVVILKRGKSVWSTGTTE